MKNYEIVWIIGGDSENLSDESIKKMEETIISSNGEVVNIESMGKRSLAYPIKKNKGSAIFLHLTNKKNYPTKGCIAIFKKDFLKILPFINKKTKISIN